MTEINENGWIAIKRYQTIPKIVTIGDDQYAFQCKFNICMTWIKPEHVGQVLAIMKGCCEGKKTPMFTYASETDVRRWTYGGR